MMLRHNAVDAKTTVLTWRLLMQQNSLLAQAESADAAAAAAAVKQT
jgi:hypothetical protein